jgi:aspartyl-tRNA(Asn)/glutamyl-tRNA(Gln) amidotransferase subunit C
MLERTEVDKVAHLARLSLTTAEAEQFTTQLRDILDYFEQLSELDVTDVEPTTRAIDVSNITRADILIPYADREAIFACAPDQEEDYFKVPKIMGDP